MREPKIVQCGLTERRSYSKIDDALPIPDLIAVQKESYRRFLDTGIMEVLSDFSPIKDYTGKMQIEFLGVHVDEDHPEHSIEECRAGDLSYTAKMSVTVRLIKTTVSDDKSEESGDAAASPQPYELMQSDLFFANLPLMTEQGTFIINGAERVIVSQLVRSPGAYYEFVSEPKTGAKLYIAQVIPNRGSYLEFETDAKNVLYVKLNKTRKIFLSTFIRAMGFETRQQIEGFFGTDARLAATIDAEEKDRKKEKDSDKPKVLDKAWAVQAIYRTLKPNETRSDEKTAEDHIHQLYFDIERYDLARVGRYKLNKKLCLSDRIVGRILARSVIDYDTGEIIREVGDEGLVVTQEIATEIENSGVQYVDIYGDEGEIVRVVGNRFVNPAAFRDQLGFDPAEADLNERVHYPTFIEALAASSKMSRDEKIMYFKSLRPDLIPRYITKTDIFASISYLIGLTHGIGKLDEKDHLGNRRIRSVGELLQTKLRDGLARVQKNVRERMSMQDTAETMTPANIVNARPIGACIKEFFGSSQLSQFMDQINPLAELTHKRRLSALGPGGLKRERASFEARDVHFTHYGRMCPIETPEGPNIGLINSLATYARINQYGFIEAPYRKVDAEHESIIQGNEGIVWLTADEEDGAIVAQTSEPTYTREDGTVWFTHDTIVARQRDQIMNVPTSKVQYMDISPKQLISVATAMIPFLENDDASRTLMGSNMQRQAVPLLRPEAPIVATGMEWKAAYDSGVMVISKVAGKVLSVSASRIEIITDDGEVVTYPLIKFARSNQGTCINQRPVVRKGQEIKVGQILADGTSTDHGEIALGRNILIGFMTWEGYNYEDAVLISEELVRDDVYTSIHIEKYEIEVRETKIGREEITADINNINADAKKNLDERGIIRVGAEVHAGDILVGKITPRGETEVTPPDKLLLAIFGDKSKDVRDTSLRVPHGEDGIIIDVKKFDRGDKNAEFAPGVLSIVRVYIAQKRKISVGDKMAGRHGNKGVISRILPVEDMPYLPDGTPLQIVLNPLGVPSRMNIGQILELHLGLGAKKKGWHIATPVFDGAKEEDIEWLLCERFKDRNFEILTDKYGLSDTLAREILETSALSDAHRARIIDEIGGEAGRQVADRVALLLMETVDGKTILYDGRSGDPFENRVSVGYMYYLKLAHLVDDKIHARSIGPYSLITQQPLGGKAQFGGQRFGEMEVWALEAYGAANTLQEMLTIKSDDIPGRNSAFKHILKGENVPEPGIPESFKVLIKELQALALDVIVLGPDDKPIKFEDLGAPLKANRMDSATPESEVMPDTQTQVSDWSSEDDESQQDALLAEFTSQDGSETELPSGYHENASDSKDDDVD